LQQLKKAGTRARYAAEAGCLVTSVANREFDAATSNDSVTQVHATATLTANRTLEPTPSNAHHRNCPAVAGRVFCGIQEAVLSARSDTQT
jgi:hypothetical protein